MHPLLSRGGRLTAYLLAWLFIGALLGYLFAATGPLGVAESQALALPLCLLYAFICLAPWYACRMLPSASSNAGRLLMNHGSAALVAAGIWTIAAKVLALALGRYFSGLHDRLKPQLALLFGAGVLLYTLAVALHYVFLSQQISREAETREQEARVQAREAELRALKAQINPHFLFNSLNSISALATVDGRRARDMCIKLSDFLRNTLSVGEKENIPLREELALAKAYLDVEQVRFGARLRVEQLVDAGCEGCRMPPLLLQPLVENAVKHGVSGLLEGGSVRVSAACAGGVLRIRVENEFDPDSPSRTRNGLGLANVRGRLMTLYEHRARLDAGRSGTRFVAELTLPCAELNPALEET